MSKGLKHRVLFAGLLSIAGAVGFGLLATAGHGSNSTSADSAASLTAKNAHVTSASKTPDDQFAGRRYRRYWRRHTV